MTMTDRHPEDDMTPEERLNYLRDRGVLVETPEERRAKAIRDIMNEPDNVATSESTTSASPLETISYVMIPADSSKPLKELTFQCTAASGGDALSEHLKPMMKLLSRGKEVDLELFKSQGAAGSLLASGGVGDDGGSSSTTVKDETLLKVAAQGNVERFPLVHATPSNHYTGVNIYLDEAGMLKRLALNPRATQFAAKAGFNPPPTFYGDVFLGRVKSLPSGLRNVDFKMGRDTAMDSDWLGRANVENLEHQMALNSMTGRTGETQPSHDGGDGKVKDEAGYSWTQTEEELEVVVSLPESDVTSKDVSVKFKPRSLQLTFRKQVLVSLALFERVDPDGCAWTLEKDSDISKVVVTLEKAEEASWPRIQD